MLALKINTNKTFMHKLLLGNTFDIFSLAEASITTFSQFHIDGKLHMDFFDTDTAQHLSENDIIYASWKDLKSYCYSIIRGKLSPLQFKFVMRLSPSQANSLSADNKFSISDSKTSDLFLNIQYKNNELICTTGIFSSFFTLDKTSETIWDAIVLDFFRLHQIDFTIL